MGLVGAGVAVLAATRIVGPLYPYLIAWASPLLLPAGLGTIAARYRSERLRTTEARNRRPSFLALLTLLSGAVLARSFALTPFPWREASDVIEISAVAERWLGTSGVHSVHLTFVQHDDWPLAAGVLLHLERNGIGSSVDDAYLGLFGGQFRHRRSADVTLVLVPANESLTGSTGFHPVGGVGPHNLWVGPDTGGSVPGELVVR